MRAEAAASPGFAGARSEQSAEAAASAVDGSNRGRALKQLKERQRTEAAEAAVDGSNS